MHRVLVIIKREYLTRVRTLGFVIGTAMTPLLMIAWIAAPGYFASGTAGERNVIVLDQSGDPLLFSTLQEQLKSTDRDRQAEAHAKPLTDLFKLQEQALPASADMVQTLREREQQQSATSTTALLVLRPGVLDGLPAEYVGPTLSDPAITASLRRDSADT